MAESSRIFRLACNPNNYPWGKMADESLVAQFAPQACSPDYKVDPSEPYSELWMGSHPTNPASVYPSGQLLSEYLAEHRELLGDAADKFPPPFTGKGEKEKEGGHVPFLFKILCCKQALPLQIHPNKDLAKQLHDEDPEQFPDTNHKPEIAVCLSDRFLGFAHFRPFPQIHSLIRAIPELQDTPTEIRSALDAFDTQRGGKGENEAMQKAWRALLKSTEKEEMKGVVSKFAKRVEKEGKDAWAGLEGDMWTERVRGNLSEAVGIMEKYYPGDPSTLAVLIFMNLVELKKGQGMYVGADGLHAWLQGDIVELMAMSDNVLNVGFTDRSEITDALPTVTRALTFQGIEPSTIALERTPFIKGLKRGTTVYSVPFEEFSILHIGGEEDMEGFSGPAIGIVTTDEAMTITEKGKQGVKYERGSVFFVGANTRFMTEGKGEVWMAFYDGDQKSAGQVGAQ